MAKAARSEHPKLEQRTFQVRPGLVETVMPIRILAEPLKTTFAELERLGNGPIWLVDCTATESFEAACIPLAGKELYRLKKSGLRRLVAVTTSNAVKMATRAVGVASGIKIILVERRFEAVSLLTLDE